MFSYASNKTILVFIIFIFVFSTKIYSQNGVCTYWLEFRDKTGTAFTLDKPEAFLTKRSIDRRIRQNISLNESDLPVSKTYIDSLKKLGLKILHTSKWLNGVTVRTADTTLVSKAKKLNFVTFFQETKPGVILKTANNKFNKIIDLAIDPADYGNSYNQLEQLKGNYLHNLGFRGKGIHIAVLDAGFYQANEINAFDSLRFSNRILGIRDFVDPSANFYQQNYHGMSVLSCMAANIPRKIIGTAPDASYYLFRSEDAATEFLIEEDNWVAAAELADSLGVDIINSSLGYSEYDDPKQNHTYSDMNGKKNRVTKGANMAFDKGILVFSSAGNEGNKPWKYILSPADGEKVIAVGSVDLANKRSVFSSLGPAYGGAVKPNVVAMGSATHVVVSNGSLGYLNGTSFSSPVLAGMAACLLQANPNAKASQVKIAIEQSSSQNTKPDSLLGYGIPNFEKADKYLKINNTQTLNRDNFVSVIPNPFSDYLFIKSANQSDISNIKIKIFDLKGSCLLESYNSFMGTLLLNNLENLPRGILFMSLTQNNRTETIKLIRL